MGGTIHVDAVSFVPKINNGLRSRVPHNISYWNISTKIKGGCFIVKISSNNIKVNIIWSSYARWNRNIFSNSFSKFHSLDINRIGSAGGRNTKYVTRSTNCRI